MMRLVTAAQMAAAEQQSVERGVSLDTLMENAGQAVADFIFDQEIPCAGLSSLVLVGPGNNGGDALVAARHLAARGASVTAYMTGSRPAADPKTELATQAGVKLESVESDTNFEALRTSLDDTDLVIDGVLGTGRARPIATPLADLLGIVREAVDRNNTELVAIDLPTGVDSDSGVVDPAGLPVNFCLMLGYPKIGPYLRPGLEPQNQVEILDIGIPDDVVPESGTILLTSDVVAELVPHRSNRSNKGTFGKVLIVGGSPSYTGAARLACIAGARSGVGLVTLATPEPVYRIVASSLSDATYLPLPAGLDGQLDGSFEMDDLVTAISVADGALFGPGMGQSPGAQRLVNELLLGDSTDLDLPLVLDADCLNILATEGTRWHKRFARAIVTPHPGEMARLTGMSVSDVQNDRMGVAAAAAESWGVTVVLKGACTVIAGANCGGEITVRISPFANSALATAGTGDVLAGVIAGLLAQGVPTLDAASLGVYVHAMAAESARELQGAAGMLASDLLGEIGPAIVNLLNP